MQNVDTSVLILTPVKSARRYLDTYFASLEKLTYPHRQLSLGILEGDSSDGTFEEVKQRLAARLSGFSPEGSDQEGLRLRHARRRAALSRRLSSPASGSPRPRP